MQIKPSPLLRAIAMFKNKAAMARALDVEPSYINKMVRTGHVPWQQCREIERITGGFVTAIQLRPDVFGPSIYAPRSTRKGKA